MKLPGVCRFSGSRGRRKSLPSPIIAVALIGLLLSSSPLGTNIESASAAGSVFYDLVTSAPAASWSSGAGGLPFPGSDSDSNGFACYKNSVTLEDDSIAATVLETHPQWVSGGWIMGRYPQVTISDRYFRG